MAFATFCSVFQGSVRPGNSNNSVNNPRWVGPHVSEPPQVNSSRRVRRPSRQGWKRIAGGRVRQWRTTTPGTTNARTSAPRRGASRVTMFDRGPLQRSRKDQCQATLLPPLRGGIARFNRPTGGIVRPSGLDPRLISGTPPACGISSRLSPHPSAAVPTAIRIRPVRAVWTNPDDSRSASGGLAFRKDAPRAAVGEPPA